VWFVTGLAALVVVADVWRGCSQWTVVFTFQLTE
jgi:hypothetical protein